MVVDLIFADAGTTVAFVSVYASDDIDGMTDKAIAVIIAAAVILNRMFEKGSLMWILSFLLIYFVIVALSYWLTCLIERYCPMMLGKKSKYNV